MSLGTAIDARFPTLSRHCALLRESWRLQNQHDADARPRTDHEFLPAALEIIDRAIELAPDTRAEKPPEGWLYKAWDGDVLVDLIHTVTGYEDVRDILRPYIK